MKFRRDILERRRLQEKREANNVVYAIERIYGRRLIYFANDNDLVEISCTHECAKKARKNLMRYKRIERLNINFQCIRRITNN